MGDIPLLCRLDLAQQVLGGRCVGSAASKHIDDLFKAVDMLRALVNIPLSDLQMSKKHRAVHRQHHSPTIGRWLLIQLRLRGDLRNGSHSLGESAPKSERAWGSSNGRARRACCDQDHAYRRDQDPDHRHDRNEPLPPSTADVAGDPGAGNQRTAAKCVNQVHRPLPKLCPSHRNRSIPLPMRTYKYPPRRKRLTPAQGSYSLRMPQSAAAVLEALAKGVSTWQARSSSRGESRCGSSARM